MRSPLGGSIATCLIFVPLVVVPLLAVLGMPQLATSKAAATGDDLKFAADEANPGGGNTDLLAPVRVSDPKTDAATDATGATHSARAGVKDPDPFAEFSRGSGAASRPGTTAGAAKRTQRWTSEGNGLPQKALLSNDPPSDDRGAASAAERTAASGSIDDHAADQPGRERLAKMPAARRQLPEAQAIVALDTEPSVGSLASRTADASTAELRSPAPQRQSDGPHLEARRRSFKRTGHSRFPAAARRARRRLQLQLPLCVAEQPARDPSLRGGSLRPARSRQSGVATARRLACPSPRPEPGRSHGVRRDWSGASYPGIDRGRDHEPGVLIVSLVRLCE